MTMRLTVAMLVVGVCVVTSAAQRIETNVVYGMHSGLALLMDVHHPAVSNGRGVIFIGGSGFHAPLGYNAPALKDRSARTPYLERLVAAGYTVFTINHRAAPRFRYPAAVDDVQRAARFVRHHANAYDIDPDRLGAFGASSGGHLASMLGTLDGAGEPTDPDPVNHASARVQCVVAAAAPSDLLRIRTEAGLMAVTSFVGLPAYGANPGTQERRTYEAASPLSHVSAGDAPTLLIHGDADDTVPFEQSELMEAALRKAGVEVSFLRLAGAGHGMNVEGAGAPDVPGEIVRWFDRHLAPKPR